MSKNDSEPHDLAAPAPHVLREYALLADGERGILVGPRGDFAWMCFPFWDDDAVFSSLLGGPGAYVVSPAARSVWGGYYEPGSLIWHNRWVTDDGAIVESREALALPSQARRAIVVRRIRVRQGSAVVNVLLRPSAKFGDDPLDDLKRRDDGAWTGTLGDICLTWLAEAESSARPTGNGHALALDLSLDAGEERDLVLVLSLDPDADVPEAEACWRTTEAEWNERVPQFDDTIAPRDARHAYAVLSGLTSSGGGMVAAATTSLPERAREGRDYDYRYVWIRDQCYAGQAVARLGTHALLDDAVRFVTARLLEDGAKLAPAYTTRGGAVPGERRLELPGYPGGRVVVGNHVNEQFQLDAFGEALLLLAAAARHDHLDAEGWRAATAAVDAIGRRWREPDAGIWELDPDTWTHSRLTCAAGLRAISSCRSAGKRTAEWLALAERIIADAAATATHESGRWQRSTSDERIDAALVLPAVRGAIPADDPRTLATLDAVARELTEDGYAYRFRPDERPLGAAEGAFVLCGFFLALAWAQQDDLAAAARWFERNRAACGPPGLLSEEFDVGQRQLRGNLPQAFAHALLLECAAALGDASSHP